MGLFHFAFMIYRAVCELKSPSMSDFLWGLENSGWLRHIKAIMDAGIFIAKVCDCEENKGETSQCMLTSDWRSRFLLKGHVPGWAALQWGAGFAGLPFALSNVLSSKSTVLRGWYVSTAVK